MGCTMLLVRQAPLSRGASGGSRGGLGWLTEALRGGGRFGGGLFGVGVGWEWIGGG
jgi:hypothetical protein